MKVCNAFYIKIKNIQDEKLSIKSKLLYLNCLQLDIGSWMQSI